MLEDQVQIQIVFGFDDLFELDHVRMIELFKYANFTEGPLGVDVILESQEHFFKRQNFIRSLFAYLVDITISSTANLLNFLETLLDMRF